MSVGFSAICYGNLGEGAVEPERVFEHLIGPI